MWYVSENLQCNYYRVYKCASSFIVHNLKFLPGTKKIYPFSFTFIRNPISRVESFIYMKCRDGGWEKRIKQSKIQIKKIIQNFDDGDVHSVPFSLNLPIKELNFIGTLENFDNDLAKLSSLLPKNIDKEKFIFNDVDLPKNSYTKTLHLSDRTKYDNDVSRFIKELVYKHDDILKEIYKNDIEIYQKIKKQLTIE